MVTKRKINTKSIILTLIICSTYVFAQNDSTSAGVIQFNSEFSYKILEPNQDLRKVKLLLDERQNGTIRSNSLTIGVSLISIIDYQKSNADSKFSYLMRHPTPSNQIGKEVSEVVIHSFQFSFTAAINNWLTACAEVLYDPEQSFGSGTITALTRNQLQLRKGVIMFGDLNNFPLYGAIGKMDAPFGQTGSVSPFSNSTMWHAFGGLGYGAQIGFKKWNINAAVMAIQGGAQFRALHTPVGDGKSTPSLVNNFSSDINYLLNIFDNTALTLGASYLHGSAYCQDFPVTHFADCDDNNPAVSYYGRLNINKHFLIKGSFATTLKVWEGTHNPAPPLDIYEASKVSSLDIGAKYDYDINEEMEMSLSAEFSNFIAGPKGAPWDRQDQIILGLSALYKKSSKIFIELFRTDGYAPLNFISGSADNDPFPPGVTHSLNSANSIGIVAGAQVTF